MYLETSHPGVFVAGDLRHGSIKRVASAVGDGAMAASLVHSFLDRNHVDRVARTPCEACADSVRANMSSDGGSKAPLASFEVPVQLKLSALWIATMFVYVYVDILAFYKPGTERDILEGQVWEFDVTQGWTLACLCS